jgi:hypothetical protein
LLSQHSGPFIDPFTSHLSIALICTTYQTFACFDEKVSEEGAVSYILNGDLRLLEYVQSSWVNHVIKCCTLSQDQSQLAPLSNALQWLFVKRFNKEILQDTGISQPQESVSMFGGGIDRLQPEVRYELYKILDYRKNFHQRLSAKGELEGMYSSVVDEPVRFLGFDGAIN